MYTKKVTTPRFLIQRAAQEDEFPLPSDEEIQVLEQNAQQAERNRLSQYESNMRGRAHQRNGRTRSLRKSFPRRRMFPGVSQTMSINSKIIQKTPSEISIGEQESSSLCINCKKLTAERLLLQKQVAKLKKMSKDGRNARNSSQTSVHTPLESALPESFGERIRQDSSSRSVLKIHDKLKLDPHRSQQSHSQTDRFEEHSQIAEKARKLHLQYSFSPEGVVYNLLYRNPFEYQSLRFPSAVYTDIGVLMKNFRIKDKKKTLAIATRQCASQDFFRQCYSKMTEPDKSTTSLVRLTSSLLSINEFDIEILNAVLVLFSTMLSLYSTKAPKVFAKENVLEKIALTAISLTDKIHEMNSDAMGGRECESSLLRSMECQWDTLDLCFRIVSSVSSVVPLDPHICDIKNELLASITRVLVIQDENLTLPTTVPAARNLLHSISF